LLTRNHMKRILLLCRHDWRSPAAGEPEQYAYEVFSRVARKGHYVVWVCCNVPLLALPRKRLAPVERVAGMLMAHLGSPFMYRFMAPLFFRRLVRSFAKTGGFDVCIDCIQGAPSPQAAELQAPVLPIVFRLQSNLMASDDPPGPVIAATTRAEGELRDAGVPEALLVRTPDGVDAASGTEGASWDILADKVLGVIESL